jgi:O-antigen ligase
VSIIIILLLCGALFIYALVYKPELVAVLLFTLIIANINFDLNSLPLNTRAIVTICLFGRILIDKSRQFDYPSFLGVTSVKLFMVYMLYVLLVSFGQHLYTMELMKQILSTILSSFCVYHFLFKHKKTNPLKTAMIVAGLICFADLTYTYVVFGSFPVQRIFFLVAEPSAEEFDPNDIFIAALNHNFFGQICGMAFVFILGDLIRHRSANRFTILLLPLMFLGVIMSTSRSALLATLVVAFVLILNGIKYKEQKQRLYKIGALFIGLILIGGLLFTTFGKYFSLDANFIDQATYRLTEEPVAIIKKALGYNYNVQDMGSMDWREEASADAYAAYQRLEFSEQLTGIGAGGFLERNIGHGLNPHNGVLLILIENGLLGLILYCLIVLGSLLRAIKLKNISPSFAVIVFIIIYGIGQNGEMTSSTMFLFISCLIAENQLLSMARSADRDFEWNNDQYEGRQRV